MLLVTLYSLYAFNSAACIYLFSFCSLLTAHLHYSPLDKYHCDGLELMDDAMTYAFVHVVLVDLLEARGQEGAFCLTHQ